MPELPHLPPVAQALAVLLGVAAAITRLLTASRSFWNVLPNTLQKAFPALLVAIGLLPAALAQAKSWLDVVTALVLVVGAYFTASRGDQRAPEGSGGVPRMHRSNTDPRVEDTARINPPLPQNRIGRPPGFLILLVAGLAMHQQSCSAAKSLPCDESKLAAIDAAYVADTLAACRTYPDKESCPAWPALRDQHSSDLKAACK